MTTVTIEPERLQSILSAIAIASGGDFDRARARLASEARDEDSLGEIEEALRAFLGELGTTTRQSTEALAALADSKSELEDKLQTIERQQVAIRELSVPIIDVWEGILTLPLVGLLDTSRAVEVTEQLLRRVADNNVDWVILDLTGVAVVDTMTAQHLIKLAQAVRLLGASCILTGLGSNVSQTLVTIGVALDELNPMRSLREALRYCLKQRQKPKQVSAT